MYEFAKEAMDDDKNAIHKNDYEYFGYAGRGWKVEDLQKGELEQGTITVWDKGSESRSYKARAEGANSKASAVAEA
jgi:hypothetical protein